MKHRIVIEHAVGETRAAVYEGKSIAELYVRRWSEAGKPRAGDIVCGRITRIEPQMDAAFVDLGFGPDGFLKFTNAQGAPRLSEGRYIQVLVTRDAEDDKGPVLKFDSVADGEKIGLIKAQSLEEFLLTRFPNAKVDKAAVNAVDDALEIEVAIAGGGDIAIEQTRALVAIDVDKGYAPSGFDVSLSACELIASQVRLRGLGGLFVIDFPNLRQVKQREKLFDAMLRAFDNDPNVVKIAPVSRFGTVEMTRAKTHASLADVMLDSRGEPTVETRAVGALRRLEKEGRANAGAKLMLTATSDIFDWLDADTIGWRAAMTDRLGARFDMIKGDIIDVSADR
ncbi:ribonuclease E/G [Fretibacter rubidus]|uniref:ribonuclease E/G n=1 Tax=Fretibacter rubidus TaxID=570162 RepID=UPI00352B40C9